MFKSHYLIYYTFLINFFLKSAQYFECNTAMGIITSRYTYKEFNENFSIWELKLSLSVLQEIQCTCAVTMLMSNSLSIHFGRKVFERLVVENR